MRKEYDYNGPSNIRRVRNGAGRPRRGYRVVRLLVKVETAVVLENLPENERGAFIDDAVQTEMILKDHFEIER